MEFIRRAYDADVLDTPEYQRMLAFSGNIEELKRIYEKDEQFEHGIAYSAVLGNHFELLKWLDSINENMDHVMHCAAETENFEILNWGLEQGLALDEACMFRASKKSDLATMDWLREHKCPWDGRVYYGPLEQYDLQKLNWLRSNGCPFIDHLDLFCVNCKRFDSLKWLHSNGFQIGTDAASLALVNKNLEILRWLKENRLLNVPPEMFREMISS